jgi:transcriptional regulator with XRE-family HTH domain
VDIPHHKMSIATIMNDFIAWLNFETEKQGWSLQQVAQRVGVSRMDLMRIAKGQARPSADLCQRVALVFDVSPVEVFGRAGFLPSDTQEIPALQRGDAR